MEIESLIIEHRPRLQSANFFIRFKAGSGQSNGLSADKISVNLSKNLISIKRCDQDGAAVHELSLGDSLDVLTNSMSVLVAQGEFLSFRVNTSPANFQRELLQLQSNYCQNLRLEIVIQPQVEYTVSCSNCGHKFTAASWARILELPSENVDTSEWFCHKSVDFNDLSNPRPGDIFYGNYYYLLNDAHLPADKIMSRNDRVHCRRCLQYLGQRVLDRHGSKGTTVKVWNENLKFSGGTQMEVHVMVHHSELGNFEHVIRKLLNDFEYVDKRTRLAPTMHKFLVRTAQLVGPSDKAPYHYLLLHFMDINLDVYEWMQAGVGQKLNKQQAIKLLYCYIDPVQRDDQLLKYWMSDESVHSVEISPNVFKRVLREMEKNSMLIPDVYRQAYGGFQSTYLFLRLDN